jgi:adenylyltransferase/sulfurtransferase
MALTRLQLERYARHILLKEVGGAGQARLLKARVLVVGAGGIGSPLLMYLAAAGVGTLGIVDDDTVSLSNLQRQIIHETTALGVAKVESAARRIGALNEDVAVNRHELRLTRENAAALMNFYDFIVDGSDTYETRLLVNDACYFLKKPLVSAAVGRFEGQLATFRAYQRKDNEETLPCYRCLYPQSPPDEAMLACEEAGILGAIAGVVGTLAAVEVVKEILELGESLAGSLLVYDGLRATTRRIRLPADPACKLCGRAPSIRDLSVHAA